MRRPVRQCVRERRHRGGRRHHGLYWQRNAVNPLEGGGSRRQLCIVSRGASSRFDGRATGWQPSPASGLKVIQVDALTEL